MKNAFLKRRNLEHIFLFFYFRALRSEVDRGFVCQEGEVLNDIRSSDVPRCLECPAGFFAGKGETECALCPKGTYQDEPRQGRCKQCPPGSWTQEAGSKSESACVPVCGHGTYSPEGLVPCLECPADSYSGEPPTDGFRECTACPQVIVCVRMAGFFLYFKSNSRQKKVFLRFCYQHANYHLPHMYTVNLLVFSSLQDTYTAGPGSRSPDECRPRCPPGMYSETGLAPCAPCPKNFFQPLAGQRQCFECHGSEETK